MRNWVQRNESQKYRNHKRMTMSVKCMIFFDGKILLLQKKDREGLRPWEFPGGGLEFGDNFKDAAIREVKEETSLDINILDIVGLWSFARTEKNFLTGIIFIAETDTDKVKISFEHTDYCWVEPKDLCNYTLQDSLKSALNQIKVNSPRGLELRKYFCDNY